MLIIIFVLGVSGTLFYHLFKPINLAESTQLNPFINNTESSKITAKVSYSEAKSNV